MSSWFSPAQCVGYVAFVLGISAFLQTKDSRLKLLNGLQCVAYALHFALLGAPSAAMCATLSTVRNVVSLKTRAVWVAVVFIIVNVAIGAPMINHWTGWLPVIATSLATVAFFMLSGVPMRLVIMGSTVCWLGNNLVHHSIGGIALESIIGLTNLSTMVRMYFSSGEESSLSAEAAAD